MNMVGGPGQGLNIPGEAHLIDLVTRRTLSELPPPIPWNQTSDVHR